jgi:hypothetical protein
MHMRVNKKVCIVGMLAIPVMLMATPGAGFVFNIFNRSTSVTNGIHEHADDNGWSIELRSKERRTSCSKMWRLHRADTVDGTAIRVLY